MMELILRKYKAVKHIQRKAPSQMLAWDLNTPLVSEDPSKVFFKGVFIKRLLKPVHSYHFFYSTSQSQLISCDCFNSSNMLNIELFLVTLIKKKILFPCINACDVPVKFYTLTSLHHQLFLSQLRHLLSILIVILI